VRHVGSLGFWTGATRTGGLASHGPRAAAELLARLPIIQMKVATKSHKTPERSRHFLAGGYGISKAGFR
jgi:hypothetical protein